MTDTKPPVVLSIAGTDPSGGAGIQADLKTFASLHCYGTSVITALVAQNTVGVQEIHAPPPSFVAKQLRSLLDDIKVDALKTGMLFDEKTADAVISELKLLKSYYQSDFPPLVVDPVCVSTSGHDLLEPEAVSTLRDNLFPLATIITPNIPEAKLFLSGAVKISSLESMMSAAYALLSFGSKAVLLKGGHLSISKSELDLASRAGVVIHWPSACSGAPDSALILEKARGIPQPSPHSSFVVDVLCLPESLPEYILFARPRFETKNTHGTGCTLSAALTCELSRGKSIAEATRTAVEYTHLAMLTSYPLGRGNGPLNHLHPYLVRSVPLPNESNPYPFISAMIQATSQTWKYFVRHPFVLSLGSGKLHKENFLHFVKQDYHYLRYYCRANGFVSAKTTSLETMKASAMTVLGAGREMDSHVRLCESFGVSYEELIGTPESAATTAYGAFLLDVGLQGDENLLLVALAPCLFGYGEVGLWLQKEAAREGSGIFLEGNAYKDWVEVFAGTGYQEAVCLGLGIIEAHIAANPPGPAQYEKMLKVWEKCVKLEIAFWDMALQLD